MAETVECKCNQDNIMKELYALYYIHIAFNHLEHEKASKLLNILSNTEELTASQIEDRFQGWLKENNIVSEEYGNYADFCYVISHNYKLAKELMSENEEIFEQWKKSIWYWTCQELRRKAYKLYQIDWLLSRNLSVVDIVKKVDIWDKQGDFEEYFNTTGFDGSLWCSYDEFIRNEYQDAEYMKELFDTYCEEVIDLDSTEEYEIWEYDNKNS